MWRSVRSTHLLQEKKGKLHEMFVWPEQIATKFAAIHSDPMEHFVDRLNYVYTVMLFMFMAALTGTKQHFGNPIQCMAPSHFPSTWVDYSRDYCFVMNTYTVNKSAVVVKGEQTSVFKEEIVYYQWVPYVLLLQAFFCYMPKFIWNIFITTNDMDMHSVVEEAMKLSSNMLTLFRQKQLKRVAKYAVGYIGHKRKRSIFNFLSGYHSFLFYVLIKWLYFGVCLCQILLINTFVGDGSLLWGYNLMQDVLKGSEWKTSGIFPRVTFCDVEIVQIGQTNIHTMQCVLMINILNEKLYITLWFWLVLLATVNTISALNFTLLLFCPRLRYNYVLGLLQMNESYIDMRSRRSLLNFVERVLKPDGILLLSFVRSHVNGLVASGLTREIWLMIDGCVCNSTGSHTLPKTRCAIENTSERQKSVDKGNSLMDSPTGSISSSDAVLQESKG